MRRSPIPPVKRWTRSYLCCVLPSTEFAMPEDWHPVAGGSGGFCNASSPLTALTYSLTWAESLLFSCKIPWLFTVKAIKPACTQIPGETSNRLDPSAHNSDSLSRALCSCHMVSSSDIYVVISRLSLAPKGTAAGQGPECLTPKPYKQ